ncbi:hypothetical protein NLJ89_g5691 [Agrocybe chaxingu]|uniref:NmrA-like domain-containing protein n=1 Tax=Agrocybe chaxingu TaxID=84603 RepID=A0A9W8JZR1_9AGAR|nr:hypothetical protein NLJ89_g5691 [Agrocybe chaxingu]
MAVLLTGGTGQTGLALARLLHAANYPLLITSRRGVAPEPYKAVKFEWADHSTFENPFKADAHIDRAYLVPPSDADPYEHMKPFIDLAVSKGVKRFVFVSASQAEKDSPIYGKVHEYLADIGVEYTILRPTWFIENLGTFDVHIIRGHDEFTSVTGKGRIPLVGVEDIAKAAFDALVAERSPNTDYILIGPELWSYDEVADLLAEVLGRKITHRQITNEEQIARFKFWMSEDHAIMLNGGEQRVAAGSEEALVGHPKAIVGKAKLRDYVEANKHLWIKA